jgi:hypothetical protein
MADNLKTHRFSPNVGILEYRLSELNNAIASGEPPKSAVDRFFSEDVTLSGGVFSSSDENRWAIALSLLDDVISAGAAVTSRDSCLHFTWPDWKNQESRSQLRVALANLREEPGASAGAPNPAAISTLPGDLTASRILQLLREGNIRLHCGSDPFNESLSYRDIFRAAVRSWSMPHRDREGRRIQFVLTVEHSTLVHPLPIGILEAGDGPPYLTRRDERFGLTTASFYRWLGHQRDKSANLARLEKRLGRFLDALIFSKGHTRGDLDRTLRNLDGLRVRAAGRSKVGVDLHNAKRAVYLERFSKALRGVKSLRENGSADSSDVYSLVRALRDVSLPSMNVEISICGALPPFSRALGGKLVAAFAADPRITGICRRPIGGILEKAFNLEKLEKVLPRHGALLITTQGLYADHSAQYNGVQVPGYQLSTTTRLEKLGTTDGTTTSLISRRTDALAGQLAKSLNSESSVSLVYGSGGSKRQRRLEEAITLIGIRPDAMYPGIPRPVYGLELVSNLPDVALLGASPRWVVATRCNPEQYAHATVQAWRERWLPTAEKRLATIEHEGDMHSGVRTLLAG